MSTVKNVLPKSEDKPTNGATVKPAAEQKNTVPVIKLDDSKPQPLEDRLHRLNQLFELQTRYNRLQSSLQKLNEFKQETGAENLTLIFRNSERTEFSTTNPAVISECIQNVKSTIKTKLKELEPQLKW